MPELTANQQAVVQHKDGNLLVSAGAGSGKTFVLTEHVISLITDPINPVSIDRLLIVTFTKAAASEMRERISDALSKALKANPDDEWLRCQQALLSVAQISTIDSFCGWVVKNFFHSIDRDPDYRIADPGELKLLSKDVYKSIVDKHYTSGDKDFYDLIDNYTGGKGDDGIYKIVDSICSKADVMPDPEAYIISLRDRTAGSAESVGDIPVLGDYAELIRSYAREFLNIADDWQDCLAGGNMEPTLETDRAIALSLVHAESTESLIEALGRIDKWGKKRTKSKNHPDLEEDLIYREIKETFKKCITDARNLVQSAASDEIAAINAYTSKYLALIAELALEYYRGYEAARLDRGIADFSDIEHMALRIITDDAKARETLKGAFDEIMIDEYQDSNDLQEAILTGISNGYNLFTVGDVKQSIYGFRNAKPDLFTGKYELYGSDPDSGKIINLHENFRCRAEVINGVNEVFDKVMTRDFGQVDYRGSARLICGASYPEVQSPDPYMPEMICMGKADLNEESLIVALRIKQLMSQPLMVKADKNKPDLRPLKYSDIAILCRKGTVFDDIRKVLVSAGIPCALQRTKGYYDTQEVSLLMDMLTIIDNPRQDIPLAAVLLSPIGGFTADDLALIRGRSKCSLYESLAASDSGRVRDFLDMLSRYRELSVHISIRELIELIVQDAGYMYYAAALPGGKSRRVNIEMLQEMAESYERTSYHGLYDFIRYIGQLKKSEGDTDSAQVLSDSDEVVRLMTVHASKGLEFPVVILMDNGGKGHNDTDKILTTGRYGLVSDYYNHSKSIKIASPVKAAAGKLTAINGLEEAARVLYVAMTRAREKLIVTYPGEVPAIRADYDTIPGFMISGAAVTSSVMSLALGSDPACWKLINISPEEAQKKLICSDVSDTVNKIDIKLVRDDAVYDEELRDRLDKSLGYEYPHEPATGVRSTYSVSELKRLHTDGGDAGTADDMERREIVDYSGSGRGSGDNKGALMGSAYHLIFEKLDPERGTDADYISSLIDSYRDKGLIEQEISAELDAAAVAAFYNSDMGRRVLAAYRAETLCREKSFVLGLPTEEIDESCAGDDPVIIQGVIDMYFREKDDIILIDYKSDYVKPGQEQILAERYNKQLDYYSKAIEAATGRYPAERYLYSIRTGSFVKL